MVTIARIIGKHGIETYARNATTERRLNRRTMFYPTDYDRRISGCELIRMKHSQTDNTSCIGSLPTCVEYEIVDRRAATPSEIDDSRHCQLSQQSYWLESVDSWHHQRRENMIGACGTEANWKVQCRNACASRHQRFVSRISDFAKEDPEMTNGADPTPE